MIQVTGINTDAVQEYTLVTDDGVEFEFTMFYRPTQNGWFFDLEYEDTSIKGSKLVNFPNILRKWKNILPFGLACVVEDGTEAYFVEDFLTGRANLYVLNESEVEQIEELYFA